VDAANRLLGTDATRERLEKISARFQTRACPAPRDFPAEDRGVRSESADLREVAADLGWPEPA
jgi:hypothetical protein